MLLGFFAYIALLIPLFPDRPNLGFAPLQRLVFVALLLAGLALAETGRYALSIGMIRDWAPMALILIAFREMELFVPVHYNARYQAAWIRWDQVVLGHWGLAQAVESLGPVIPCYLELCYLLVYGVGTFCVLMLWLENGRRGVDRFYVILLTGTLVAYALFPYFPSEPPRLAFPNVCPPHAYNIFRKLNLYLLAKASIHSGVFPSAHVSSAFAAAWAMFLVLPKRKMIAWLLLFYACSVALATVYGRYHYTADAVAGFAVSLLAGALCLVLRRQPALVAATSEVSG
jgi:membrane-associated phospholipid phosphatase